MSSLYFNQISLKLSGKFVKIYYFYRNKMGKSIFPVKYWLSQEKEKYDKIVRFFFEKDGAI